MKIEKSSKFVDLVDFVRDFKGSHEWEVFCIILSGLYSKNMVEVVMNQFDSAVNDPLEALVKKGV